MAEKWAVVTGASGGIGLDIAKQLAERGYHLVLVARSKSKLEEVQQLLTSSKIQVRVVALDLSKPDSADELVHQTDKWGIVPEVLINNAGVGALGPFLDSKPEEVRGMLDLNIDALILLSHLYGRKMREQRLGYILQVASTAAFQPMPSFAVYAATKSFVLNFSRALNFEAKPFGVTSTALCPGPTATGFFASANFKPNRSFSAMMMQSDDVARQGLDAMFDRQEVHVSGLMNKITAALPRLLPVNLVMKSVALIMK